MIMQKKHFILDGVCYTSDLDWASESAISMMLEYFDEQDIHPTIFMTHPSRCVKEYACRGRVDLGIHPNFILPSSQGNSISEVIDYCLDLLPQAKVFRCHRWYASNDIYDLFYQKGLRYESNLCTLLEVVEPFRHRSGMISFPTFFEDGAWIYHGYPMKFQGNEFVFDQPGLKVINIHPMHFVLNTPYFRYMRDIKDRLPRERWNSLTKQDMKALKNDHQPGIQDFLRDMVSHYRATGTKQYTLQDAYKEWTFEEN